MYAGLCDSALAYALQRVLNSKLVRIAYERFYMKKLFVAQA